MVDRGEAASFFFVTVVLVLSVRLIGRVTGAAPRRIEDVYWWGGIFFLVVGRLAYVASSSPGLLTDLAVLVRFTDGLDPIAGAAAGLAWAMWKSGGGRTDGSLWVASVVGLVLAAVAYDLTCSVRASCYGVPASGPLGFPMHGLAEPRMPTPVFEGVVLLVLLGVTVRLLDRWDAGRAGWALLAAASLTRLAALPLTVQGLELSQALVLLIAATVAAGLAIATTHRVVASYASDRGSRPKA